jgi:excisionase family DNA binding protein
MGTVARAPDPNKLAYSLEETAALLGVHPNTVKKYVKSGELPSRRLGDRWLVPADGLRDWLRSA